MTRTVRGFHGTTQPAAEAIQRDGFRASANDHDWLGMGSYFFEGDPDRALAWPKATCAVQVEIDLTYCWDLSTMAGRQRLVPFYGRFVDYLGRARAEAIQQSYGARRLDCAVVNYACERLTEQGQRVDVVRGVFEEGDTIWSDPLGAVASSLFLGLSHVQLAVRNNSALDRVSIWKRP